MWRMEGTEWMGKLRLPEEGEVGRSGQWEAREICKQESDLTKAGCQGVIYLIMPSFLA